MIGRSHLREVSNRWEGSTVDGKTDISPQDAKIIDMLIDFFASSEKFEEAQLLSEWKKVGDDKFHKLVEKFTNYEDIDTSQFLEEDKENDEDYSPTFITFNNISFSVSSIQLIKQGSSWSKESSRNIFYIELNSKGEVWSTPTIKKEFRTEELRDKSLKELKQKLMSFGIKFI